MKRHILIIIAVALLLLVGVCVLLYPSISTWINGRNQSRAIQTYVELVEELDSRELETQWELARQYNQTFMAQSGDGLDRSISAGYEDVLNLDGSGVMGYIEIPVIGLHLPVYHGTGEKALQRGAGHIPETPLPIGGDGNHAVLTGHRASAIADLFTELDKLEENDIFLLHVLDTTLAYQVDRITVVEPAHIQDLLPVAGKDYVTLVTCTPYAINSHRLLVRGTRIDYTPDMPLEARELEPSPVDLQIVIICAFMLLWAIIILVLVVLGKRRRRGASGKRNRHGALFFIVLLLLGGVAVLSYPSISNLAYQRQADQSFAEFKRQQENSLKDMETDPLLKSIHQYNAWLYEIGQKEGLQDPFAFEQTNGTLVDLGYTEDVFGFITIERLGLRLPVYLGSSQENLRKGAAHMTYTSIPVGGLNTNACVIGHRNLSSAEMFRDIDLLEAGDIVKITNPWKDLEYVVVSTKTIWPEDVEDLTIQQDRDLLTLISCHPKGENTKRYLVFCDRLVNGQPPYLNDQLNLSSQRNSVTPFFNFVNTDTF